jgi:hypothetical protein
MSRGVATIFDAAAAVKIGTNGAQVRPVNFELRTIREVVSKVNDIIHVCLRAKGPRPVYDAL